MTNTLDNIIGKTITEYRVGQENDTLVFKFDDGSSVKFYHAQDCCEEVLIDDICGDLDDLVGNPLLVAEENVSDDRSIKQKNGWDDSWTWTFYKFATIKGYVDIKWYGCSNGYYSESVSMRFLDAEERLI